MVKKALFILLLFIPIILSAQRKDSNYVHYSAIRYIKRNAVPASLAFVAGVADGMNETLKFHYSGFKAVFPKANDNFFDPSISWKNKYKNGNQAQGAKFFGSTTFFVNTTDAYHLLRSVQKTCIISGIILKIGKHQPWYFYLVDFATYSITYSVGFNGTYEFFHYR
jgi:hypothetical protein